MSAELLIGRTRFQAFLFAGAICMLLVNLVGHGSDIAVIHAVTAVTLAAIVAFVVLQALYIFRPPPAGTSATPALNETPAWLDDNQIRAARGFIILGLIVYLAYHYLDVIVIADSDPARQARRVDQMLWVRLLAAGPIALTFALSFTNWFKKHYVGIVATVTVVAGAGVGVLFYIAGPTVHFYYEGFIQIIAFAAFAFRLPPRPLGFICGIQMLTYAAIALSQANNWDYFSLPREQQAVIANNLTSLLTFVALAMAASAALHSRRPQTSPYPDPGFSGG